MTVRESAQTPPQQKAAAVLRDQRRALHAYQVVGKLPDGQLKEYCIAINDLCANVLRSGLAAALAALERQKDGRGRLVLQHLAEAEVPGLEGATGNDLAERARQLDVDAYMLATREILGMAAWLKRAVQAYDARNEQRKPEGA